ncbi:toprim domain-containing protein [Klebsiella pneumoniae]
MNNTVHQEVIRRLICDFEFKTKEKYLQQGICPNCHKREMFTSIEHPYLIKCGRENKCGHEFTSRSLYRDLFENWSNRYEATQSHPYAVADAYLSEGRGLDITRFKGAYTQGSFARKGLGSATVRFTLSNGNAWERIIDEPERFEQKANFVGSYAGYWWEPPGIDLRTADKIFITEGIFNAMSLVQSGLYAVATLSSNNYPSMLLSMLAENLPADRKRPRLIWAFDDDRAGRSHIIKFAQRAIHEGWEVSAALPSENGSHYDWNDLLLRDRLTAKDMKQYRHYGRLLLAQSAAEKALLIYQHNEWNTFHFNFGSRTFWFELDFNKYMTAVERIQTYDKECYDEEDAKRRALKETGMISEIANCTLTPLYFQRSEPTDESWYYLRVGTPNAPSVKGTFTANQLASSAEFKKRLLHIAKGGMYTGSTKQLDIIFRSLQMVKEVKTQNFIGYNKEFRAWVLNDVAVSDGRVYHLNDEDYFEIQTSSVKSLSLTPSLSINADLSQFDCSWLEDIWTAFGAKGYAALAFWFGSLFAEQIRELHKSFPFLEIVGEPGTGKSTLIEFLWKLVGREEYEGFDPSKSTPAARGRNFSQVANLPVVLIEGDRSGTTDRPMKQRAFDYDELKSLYNGRASRALGIKTNNNETYEPPFRGSIVIAQNADVDGSEALLSRIIHMYTDKAGQTAITQAAAERLEQTPCQDVSGFFVAATQKENEVLLQYDHSYQQARNDMAGHADIKHKRVTKTHSQLIGMLEALPLVIPVRPERIVETRNYIFTLAAERQRALSLDHPMVQEFWELFDYLDSQEPFGMNHTADNKPEEIAINFNHLEEVASLYRQRLTFTLSEIKKLLKGGREREFVRAGSVRSAISEKYNTGKAKELRKPDFYHCWTFRRK